MDSTGPGLGLLADSSELGKEPSGSIKGKNF
jgi:hypothetical protein